MRPLSIELRCDHFVPKKLVFIPTVFLRTPSRAQQKEHLARGLETSASESGERNFLASNLFGVRLSLDFIRAKS